VRKWVRRYHQAKLNGLNNLSQRPLHSPGKTPDREEQAILELRDSLKKIGARRLKYEFEVQRSASTIYQIFKRNGRLKPTWKKHKKKNDLRAVKAKLKVFEKIQIDIKELKDIPNYYSYMSREKLPKYQFTARDVKSGALFFALANSKDGVNASIFCAYLLEHLKRFNIDVSKVKIQTDNDGAFVGNWRVDSSASFRNLVEQIYQATHLRIPPSAPTYNSDVETVHARIEEELYDIEEFDSEWLLLSKALTYQVYFNLIRPNSYKKMKSPIKIIEEELGPVDPYLLVLQPVILDQHFNLYMKKVQPSFVASRGYHLSDPPIFG